MSKNLVLLSDGTGQRGGVGYETNVWRLYKSLKVQDGQQLVCYDDGVGSQRSRLDKIFGGMAAIGLNRNVRELYEFLVRHWQQGDRIYLFGFSRGAFTVRILADIVSRCGLIDLEKVDSEQQLTKLVETAYNTCLKSYYRPAYAENFKSKYSRSEAASIHFIGVWDTVGAIGLPFAEARYAMHNMLEYGFRGLALNSNVQKACHACAIDDCRQTFHPVTWDERVDETSERIEQVWFAGVHSNVGGGYPKNQLASVTLNWMIQQVQKQDAKTATDPQQHLQFLPQALEEITQEKNAHGKLYNSRSGFASAFRFRPRDLETIRQSYSEEKLKVHPSVLERIDHFTDAYSPHNLTKQLASDTKDQALKPLQHSSHWQECMDTAESYSLLQRIIYHAFMSLIAVVIVLMLWKLVAGAPSVFTSSGIDWQALLSLTKQLLGYGVLAALFLGVSEMLQHPLRQRQNRIAGQGWSKLFPDSRIDNPQLLEQANNSWLIKLAKNLNAFGIQSKFSFLLQTVIYLLIYSIGLVYSGIMLLSLRSLKRKIKVTPENMIEPTADKPQKIRFETNMSRMHTGIYLRKGTSYQIKVEKHSGWFDAQYKATPEGLDNFDELPGVMQWGHKHSRLSSAPMFALLGEIDGGDPFPVGMESIYQCDRDGELVLYVNDTSITIGLGKIKLPLFPDFFYFNNKGAAKISVAINNRNLGSE